MIFCKIQNCNDVVYGSKEYCRKHYRQLTEGKLLPSILERSCKGCDKLLTVKVRPGKLFCTKSCKQKYHRNEGCYSKERALFSRGKCQIVTCDEPIHAHRFCKKHYFRYKTHGDPLVTKRKQPQKCWLVECMNIHLAKGYCRRHYHSWRKYQDPYYIEKKSVRFQAATKCPEYSVWQTMIARCHNPKAANYKYYGAKGIAVHEPWRTDFWKFYDYVGKRPGKNFHIDRINSKGHYSPGNVQWLQASENSRKHSGVRLTSGDAREIRGLYPLKTMKAIAILYGLTIGHVCAIVSNEVWKDEEYKPPLRRRRNSLSEQTKSEIKFLRQQGWTYEAISEQLGVSTSSVQNVINNGKKGKRFSHPLYQTWLGMRARCNNLNHSSYPYYGGRGVQCCKEWDDFWIFVNDVPSRPSKRHTLDRVNVNGNYEPGNIRWATYSEQNKNKTRPDIS